MLSPVRLSVRLLDGCIIQKWLKLGLRNFYHTLWFLWGKFLPEILRGSPNQGRQTREGWVKSAVFYLSLTVYISKTVADMAKVTIND